MPNYCARHLGGSEAACQPKALYTASAVMYAVAVALILAGYVAVIAGSSFYSLLDLPNHIARCTVMADLIFHHGAQFGGVFHYRFMAVPYVFGDLVVSSLVELFDPAAAAAIWTNLAFLSLPAAFLLYLRVAGVSARGQLIGVLVATYLSTDWSFFAGFIEFRLGVSFLLLALALAELFRQRRSMGVICLYAIVVIVGYLTHFTTLVFLAAAIPVSGILHLWRRRSNSMNEFLLLLPIAVLLAWHFGVATHYGEPGDSPGNPLSWGTLSGKLLRIPWEFRRFPNRFDTLTKIAFGAWMCAMLYRRVSIKALSALASLNMFALAVMFLGLYFALPVRTSDTVFVDVRALVPATLFLVSGFISLPDPAGSHRGLGEMTALPLAVLIAVGNLVLIAAHYSELTAWIDRYRAIVASIPRGSQVLPVTPFLGAPYTHAGSAVIIEAGGIIPYLFSGNYGHPM